MTPTVLLAAILLGGLMLAASLLLRWAGRRLPADEEKLVEAIMSHLPQTQCGQCGQPGCRPYAQALARGEPQPICPPGGEPLVRALRKLLGDASLFTEPLPGSPVSEVPKLALIREAQCIGCGFCKEACPVDAIIGAVQHMHTVIAVECTGCELCLAPCPVDCIEMVTP